MSSSHPGAGVPVSVIQAPVITVMCSMLTHDSIR